MHANQKILSTPHRMVWELFGALRRMADRIEATPATMEDEIRQDAAVSIILAVQCVEVFLNVYFRVLVGEKEFEKFKPQVMADLENQVGLKYKLKEWPNLLFDSAVSLGSGAGQRFLALKERRDRLTHFSSTHETLNFAGISLAGLSDTSEYDSLDIQTARWAKETAEAVISEIFQLRGIPKQDIKSHVHQWLGVPG